MIVFSCDKKAKKWLPAAFAALLAGWAMAQASNPAVAHPSKSGALHSHLKLPLSFEAAPGSKTSYWARGERYAIALDQRGLLLRLPQASGSEDAAVLRVAFGQHALRLSAEAPRESVSNWFLGGDPAGWRRGVPHFGRLRARRAYPGIDVVFYGNQRRIEFDFVLAPGADPGLIEMSYQGGRAMRLNASGDLILELGGGTLRQMRPESYQLIDGRRRQVPSRYRLEDGRVGIEVGEYDSSRELIIDPVLGFATYLGGAGDEGARAMLLVEDGLAYVCGVTQSTDFPADHSVQPASGGEREAFLSLIDTRSQSLIFSTFLGGKDDDFCVDLARDGDGDVFLLGQTESRDFPIVDAVQEFRSGNTEVFLATFNASGSELKFSTFFGGSSRDVPTILHVNEQGDMTFMGSTRSFNFPLREPLQDTPAGGDDLFITRLSRFGVLVFSTLIGGDGGDRPFGADFRPESDDSLRVFITGETRSTNFPLANPLQDELRGDRDAFVMELDLISREVLYSTYLGGEGVDIGRGVHIDPFGLIFVVGETDSEDFVVLDPLQGELAGGFDLFATRLNVSTNAPIFSTFLGGGGDDFLRASLLAPSNNLLLAGFTDSVDFPVVDAVQGADPPGRDGFLAQINPGLRLLTRSTYLGGNGRDEVFAIALDDLGRAFLAGETTSTDLASGAEILQGELAGGADAFLASIIDTFVLNFAQFGDGGGLSSQIELVNKTVDRIASATVILRNDAGEPMTVDLNGDEVTGELQVQVPGGGNLRLETDGQGDLQTGALQVLSDVPLSGFVFFDAGPEIGATGVGASPVLRRFISPVRVRGAEVDTGLALMGLGSAQALTLTLRESSGRIAAAATLDLGAFEHKAQFISEVAWDRPVDFSTFDGNLILQGAADLSATAILTEPGKFIVVPVTPLD